ncbi:L-rhamnose-proton symporter [subsurface metagenome]
MVALGVFLHTVGGFAAGSFYMAFKKVRNWSWESYWLVNGLFTWLIMPWVIAILTVPELKAILRGAPLKSVFWTFIFAFLPGKAPFLWTRLPSRNLQCPIDKQKCLPELLNRLRWSPIRQTSP